MPNNRTPYSFIIAAVVIALFFSINLLFDEWTVSFDLTENRIFSLSPQSYTVMESLDHDVTVYGLYETGSVNKLIDEILRKYSSASSKIHIEYIDPVRNPDFVQQFEYQGNTPSRKSLIISGGGVFKVLSEADLFEIGMNVQRLQQVQSLVVERRVTGALLFINGGNDQNVAVLQGHGEASLPPMLKKIFELENYKLHELDLRSAIRVPVNVNILIMNLPERDLLPVEADAIAVFLEEGGRAIFLIGPIFTGTPNLNGLMSAFGVEFTNALITENDVRYYAQIPLFLLPKLKHHEILESLVSADMRVVVPYAQYFIIHDLNDPNLQVEPLLETSEKARLQDEDVNGPEGPFAVAAAVILAPKDVMGKESRIIVVGSGAVSDPDILRDVPGNVNFILNGFNWLAERDRDLTIRPKSLLSFRLSLNRQQSLIYSGIVVILIPLLIFGAGLGVWLWRRRL